MSGQFGPTRASDNIRPPVAGDVAVYDVTTSSQAEQVPDNWRYRYVTIQAETADVYIVFGPSGVTASGSATVSNPTGQAVLIPSTGTLECYIPGEGDPNVQYFAFVGTAAGKLRTWPSSPFEGGSP